MNIQKMEI